MTGAAISCPRCDRGMGTVDKLNAELTVPRRTTVLLCDETTHNALVIGRVRETRVLVRADDESYHSSHCLVRVHIDGEELPRLVEWTRLTDVRKWLYTGGR